MYPRGTQKQFVTFCLFGKREKRKGLWGLANSASHNNLGYPLLHEQEVAGSSPAPPTIPKILKFARKIPK